MNAYIQEVLEKVEKRDKNEPELLQTVEEVLKSLETLSISIPNTRRPVCLSALLSPSV